MAALTNAELDSVISYIYSEAEDALENGSCTKLRETMESISDICNPGSLLDVDTENNTVEITEWEDEEEEESPEGET